MYVVHIDRDTPGLSARVSEVTAAQSNRARPCLQAASDTSALATPGRDGRRHAVFVVVALWTLIHWPDRQCISDKETLRN